MGIKVLKNSEGIHIIEVQCNLDLMNSTTLKELVMKMIGRKAERFIINLEKVESINSSGIGALINISSTVKKLGLHLAFCNVNEPVINVLETVNLSNYFPITDNITEALELVRK